MGRGIFYNGLDTLLMGHYIYIYIYILGVISNVAHNNVQYLTTLMRWGTECSIHEVIAHAGKFLNTTDADHWAARPEHGNSRKSRFVIHTIPPTSHDAQTWANHFRAWMGHGTETIQQSRPSWDAWQLSKDSLLLPFWIRDLQFLILLQECDAIEGQLKGYVLNFKGQAKLKIFLDQDAQGSLPGARIPWFGGLISGTDLLRLHQRLVKRCHSWSQSVCEDD